MTRRRGSRGKGHEVSDQDFFFDEEPAKKEKAADKPAKSGTSKSPTKSMPAKSVPAKSAPSKSAPAPVATPFFEQNVSMAVAGMLGVIGILIGVIVGFLLGGMGSAAILPTDTTLTAPAASTGTGTGTAPELTPQQQGGGLPAGHPSIGGTSSGTASATK